MPIFLTVSPLDAVALTRTPIGFVNASDPDAITPVGSTVKFWPGIAQAPVLNREGWNGDFDSSIFLPQAAVDVNLSALRDADADAPSFRWTGAPFRIYRGEPGATWAELELLFDGLVLNATLDASTLKLTAQVDSEPFEEKCLTIEYAGTGGAEGSEDLKERSKPMCFGNAENVEPISIDETNHVYQVHGYGPIQAFRNLYERGITFGAAIGDYADYAALIAATIPEGQWGTCLAQGMFRLGAPPAGLITCDVSGDNTGGFWQTTADVIRRWCEIVGVDLARLDTASFTGFDTAVPYPISVYQLSPDKLIDVIAAIVRPCNAHMSMSWLGKLQVTRFATIPSPTVRFDAQGRERPPVMSCEEMAVSAPFWRLEVQYARSWRVHTRDELVLDTDQAIVPKSVYKHYPEQPATPTGDGTPAGWYDFKPEMSRPVDLGDGKLLYGPVWESHAMQQGGTTQPEGWSTPVMDDPRWRGWLIEGTVDSDDVLGGPNSLRVLPDGTADCRFIRAPIAGPWRLHWWVKDSDTRAAVGVMFSDPAALGGALTWSDIHTGVLIAPQNGAPFGLTTYGIFPFTDGVIDSGFSNDEWNRCNAAVPSYSEYVLVSNGEMIDLWINRERVRTWVVDRETLGDEAWPVIYLEGWAQSYGTDTDIFEIEWSVGTPARILDFPIVTWAGALRRMKDQEGFEVYAPFMPNSTASGGVIVAKSFKGGGLMMFDYANVAPGASGTSVIEFDTASSNCGRIELNDNGTYAVKVGGSTRATGTWVDGDTFAILYEGKYVHVFLNSARLTKKKVGSNQTVTPRIDLTQLSRIYNIVILPRNEGEYEYRGSVLATGFSVFTDASPQNPGGYTIIGTTTDLAFAPVDTEDGDDLRVTALLDYYWASGAPGTAASWTPDAKVEVSEDNGGTWSNHPGTWDPTPALGATNGGAARTLTFTETAPLSRTAAGTIRARLVAKNTVTGTYTITPQTNSFVQVEWLG